MKKGEGPEIIQMTVTPHAREQEEEKGVLSA